jgi:hypothetical protein
MNLSTKKPLSYYDLGFGKKMASAYDGALKIFVIKLEE